MATNSKEKQREYNRKRGKTARGWAVVTWPDSEPEDWRERIVDTHVQMMSALHDKDENPDGEKKKDHRHTMAIFETPVGRARVEQLFNKVFDGQFATVIPLDTVKGYARYLTHMDNPEKAQYEHAIIECFNGASWTHHALSETDEAELILDEICDWVDEYNMTSYRELCRYARTERTEWKHVVYSHTLFIKEYLPHVMELGRSFVAPEYQSSKAGAKALFALDNLWDGIAAIATEHPQIIYFFGKMTMYPDYDRVSRDLILHFLWKHFPDPEELVRPYKPLMPETNPRLMDVILKDQDFKDDYRNLKDAVRRLGTNIPPLVNSYMNTSPSMKMLGTAINDEFSDVEETGILVCFNDMYPEKRDRHANSFWGEWMEKVKDRFPRIASDAQDRLKERRQQRRDRVFERFNKRTGNNKEEKE